MSPLIEKDPILSSLWRYWDAKRGHRRMPQRREIEPAEIPRLLPHLQLVERVEDKGYRHRLTGSAVAQGYGFDATGKFTQDVLSPARHEVACRHFSLVFDAGRALFTSNRYVKGGFLQVMISRIILPLSLDGASVGVLLLGHTFAAPTDEQPGRGGAVEIDSDEFQFLEGPPTLSLVPPARVAAAR